MEEEDNISQRIYRGIKQFIRWVTIAVLVLIVLYAATALWDNHSVYIAAEDVQRQVMELKPNIEEPDERSFDELQKINPDVVAWLTIDHTGIDYPIVQGETNLTYVNRDVYQNFSLAGTIFVDTRNDRKFFDHYTVLYGHDMAQGMMFGDLQLFKTKTFLAQNHTGRLILPERVYDLEIFACLLVDASNDSIFHPIKRQGNLAAFLEYVQEEALCLNATRFEKLERQSSELQILALTTCSYEFTDARTVVLASMIPQP